MTGASARRALAGLLAATMVFATAELIATFIAPAAAPLQVLGATVIDHTPDGIREWAIRTFGRHDKAVLFGAMGLVAVLTAALAGLLEDRRRPLGSLLFALLGLSTAGLAMHRPGATIAYTLPAVLGTAVGIAALRLLIGRARTERTAPADRRAFLRAAATIGIGAVATGIAARLLGATDRAADASRAAVRLPTPAETPTPSGTPAPADGELRVPGLTSYYTSNAEFYRIDTALSVPRLTTADWSLRIHGMVERELRLSFADLADRPVIARPITLTCVSNPVGGDLIGNATWLGYPLAALLAEAGPLPDADMVLSRSVDNFTAGTPLAALTDGRDALLAIGMNGEPLPTAHGFPARLVVPGLYGYVSATKWVTELEVTRFDRARAYWTVRGWSERGPIKTGTRIDVPGDGPLAAGAVTIAGVAWAQHRGIGEVRVQIDDGDWQPARLAPDRSVDTWRQWAFDWRAEPGTHTIRARATDGAGNVQTSDRADVVPDGATGYPERRVQVR